VLDDIGADAFKTGMLHKVSVIEAVADTIASYTAHTSLVLDPVMFAKGGTALLQPEALVTLKIRLIPLATIITPNIPEAEYLSEIKITSVDDMKIAATRIMKLGCKAVLLKGGHQGGETVTDLLLSIDGFETFTQPRLHTPHTHGTGCALASAIATGLAQGLSLRESVQRGRSYVRRAIEAAPGFGKGHGPLGHALSLVD